MQVCDVPGWQHQGDEGKRGYRERGITSSAKYLAPSRCSLNICGANKCLREIEKNEDPERP